MEKIFKDFRAPVADNGFSQRVISQITPTIEAPSQNTYRIPTLIASICTIFLIIITTISLGLGAMNTKYEQIAASMQTQINEEYAENELSDEDIEKNFQGQLSDTE